MTKEEAASEACTDWKHNKNRIAGEQCEFCERFILGADWREQNPSEEADKARTEAFTAVQNRGWNEALEAFSDLIYSRLGDHLVRSTISEIKKALKREGKEKPNGHS